MTTNRSLRFAFVFSISLWLVSVPGLALAQETGRIVGRVLDVHGNGLAGAQVGMAGSTVATTTAMDGRFTLLRAPAGQPVELRVRMIGYQPKAVSGVIVPVGGGVQQDVTLTPEVFQLEAITVTAAAERGSVNAAMDEVRNASVIISSLPAELIRKTPDSDAGQAVQRVAGVTVQDGKYVFVRGLGERYTTTALNGARIPSPEPEKKVVPLDLFPSGLLDGITTAKTFTPDQPGDFSGAQVNLKTREFPLGRVISFSASAGFNDAATGKPVLRAPTLGSEWLGLAGTGRNLPGIFGGYDQNLSGATQSTINQMVASFRNSWNATTGKGSPNGGMSVSLGGEDPVFGRLIGYIGSFTYSYGQEIRLGERRAVYGAAGRAENNYQGETARSSVTWGGLLNLSSRIGSTSKITLNNTLTLSGDNEASRVAGLHTSFAQQLELSRLTFVERTVRSNQLTGAHLFGQRHSLDWSATSSAVRRSEPDRSDLVYLAQIDSSGRNVTPYEWFGASRSALRTFGEIKEHSEEGGLSYRVGLGESMQTYLKIGALAKFVDRDADTRAYDILTTSLTQSEKTAVAEDIFSGPYAQAGRFYINPIGSLGRYDANDQLYAGYAQLELPIGERVRLIGGARVEHSRITVNTRTLDLGIIKSELRDTDVLPSIAFTINSGNSQNIRLSASQTLSRPEYRELSPTSYLDILGGQTLFGNPNLKRALVQNFDARWEWYPGQGQTVSLAAFAKRFHQPIERVGQQRSDGSTTDATFENAKSARNYGLEFEVRHSLAPLSRALAPFTLFANTTLMQSNISLRADRNPTNPERAMVGQSEYVVNTGLGYSSPGGRVSATVLFNVSGPRIFEAGIDPIPDAYEQSRKLLDASLQLPLLAGATIKLDAKNLLDSPYALEQGEVTRLYYRSGRTFSAGVSWKP